MKEFKLEADEKLDAAALIVSKIAHDFNNTLGAVEGYATLLLNDAVPSSQMAEDLREINRAVEKAALYNKKLLNFARRKTPELVETPLAALADEKALKEAAGSAVLSLEIAAGFALCSPGQIKELLSELVLNASKAVSAGGLIKVSARNEGSFSILSVSDSGCGIKEEDLPGIFYPFCSSFAGGKGMGLALVYGICRRHKAIIKVRSGEGEGSEFLIFIPR